MRAHTVGHVDTLRGNGAVHPCTQTDKVTVGLGCGPINFPPHPFMSCAFYFAAEVLSGGSSS